MSERVEIIGRAVAAYEALAELAESVEEEWQYVTDLTGAYSAALESLAASEDALPSGAADAVAAAVEEAGLIADPHRAIDWLSTFPHVVALAVGGDVDSVGGGEPGGRGDGGAGDPDEDDDNPFRLLLGGSGGGR